MAGHAGQDQPKITQVRAAALLDKDTASGIATTGGVDMAGYDRVAFDINIGTAVASAVFNAWLVESNESNLGNATNIQKASNSSVQIAITSPAAAGNMNNTTRTLEVYRPAKRYVGCRFSTATANVTTLSCTARQYRGTGKLPATVTTDHEYVAAAAYQA